MLLRHGCVRGKQGGLEVIATTLILLHVYIMQFEEEGCSYTTLGGVCCKDMGKLSIFRRKEAYQGSGFSK